jgi:hypothetical protein
MFTSLTDGTKTFSPTAPGIYTNNTVSFGDADDYIKVRPGSTRNDGSTSAGMTYVIDHEDADGVRRPSVVTVNFILHEDSGHGPSTLNSMLASLLAVCSGSVIDDVLQGRS